MKPCVRAGRSSWLRRAGSAVASKVRESYPFPLSFRWRMKMTRLLALATALLLAAASPAQPAGDEESLRQAFLAAFNRERAEARAPALGLSRRLVTAAQQHADDISRRANLRTGPADQERMDERLHKEGYHSQRWTESVISSTEEIGSVVRYWKRESGDLYRQVMDPDFREIGIG